ncbi:hypothetical protein ACFSW8_13585 [Rubritalea tangerina]|uniref:Uncharacterized protein n=2 Tax=Rubritalea tangerina TaxID=430798 RepID=A0ABW4ZD38_9BACT
MMRLAFLTFFLLCGVARAGMTVITLTDVAEMRLQSLSFFIASYLLMALFVKWLWNYLAKSFEKIPHLKYRQALALALVSGLFLYVILTMISGARELLTPGAWQKNGYGYKLKDTSKELHQVDLFPIAFELRDSLMESAKRHDGAFPASLFTDAMLLTNAQSNFSYRAGLSINTSTPTLLAYASEPQNSNHIVILTDGTVTLWPTTKIQEALFRE